MPHPNEAVIVRHPEVSGIMVTLNPAVDYAPDDVLVKTYPWAFEAKSHEIVESVRIEQATAAPGERRGRTRKG